MKFKVGDRVRIIKDDGCAESELINQIATISYMVESFKYPYCLSVDGFGGEYWWKESEIELSSEEQQSQNYQEAKDEVLFVVDYALKELYKNSGNDKFTCPNGEAWIYDDVMVFLRKNLRW